MRLTTGKILMPFLLTALFLAGCAGAPARPDFDTSGLVWPAPPEQPRVKYVAIYKNNTDVEKAGFATWLIGGGDVVKMRLGWPRAVAVDAEGRIYVSHRWGMVVFDTVKGEMRPFADQLGREVKNPRGIAVAPDGRIFIADNERDRVMVYSPKNKFLMQIGKKGEFENPQGLAIDPARSRLYVADAKKHSLRAYDLDGKFLFSIDSTRDMPAEKFFKVPTHVAVDSKGNIYLVSAFLSTINIYSPEGDFIRSFGDPGDLPGQFARPKGIAVDSEDNVYVADAAFNNFQIFDPEGRLLLYVSQGGARPGELSLPAMMYIDRHDRIYVAERGTHRIQVFQYLSDLYYREHPEEKRPEPPGTEAEKPEESATETEKK